MRRREFIAALGGSAAVWPLAARAQHPAKVYHVAIVAASLPIGEISETADQPDYVALFKELRRLGYDEGRNLTVKRYSGEGRTEQYANLAREVVHANPDVVLTAGHDIVWALKAATNTIPIVAAMGDVVADGIVTSLARPGGNITGVSVVAGLEIWGKRLQILREVIPTASRVGFLASQRVWDRVQGDAIRAAAQQLNISLVGPSLQSPIQQQEYRRVLEELVQEHADGLIVYDQTDNLWKRRLIVELVEKARLPTVYPFREFFEVGGLVAYGDSVAEVWRRIAGYVDQILRGAKPGEIPIYLESKFELLLNLKTAKALGIEMPTSLLVRANEVME
jgi:putative tryptophan/tyrosine transport system substrate-binding protein